MTKPLTLSIVIPVYNEQDYLDRCLRAIAKQTIKPLEVIVVDNNSTDNSAKIAKNYPFVRSLKESRQGQVFAQATGFDAARADILGRIDADTVLPADWVERVVQYFTDHSQTVALTGSPDPYDIAFKRLGRAIFNFYHTKVTRLFSRKVMLWGANAAFKAESWPKIKPKIAFRSDVWEDFEMSFWLAKHGQVDYVKSLRVGCSFRATHGSLNSQIGYQFRAIRTIALHMGKLRTVLYFLTWCTAFLVAPLILLSNLVLKIKHK